MLMKNGKRKALMMLLDAVMVVAAFYLALWLRFDGVIEERYLTNIQHLIPFAVIIYLGSFTIFRLYHRMWEYASIREMMAVVLAGVSAAAVFGLLVFALDTRLLPRSIHIISFVLVVIMIGALRLTWRVLREHLLRQGAPEKPRALIVGAGDAGVMVAREMLGSNNGLNLVPVGYVDDDLHKHKMLLHGLRVLGDRGAIPELVRQYNVDTIIIAMPSVSNKEKREIIEICRRTRAKLKIVPGVYELIDGKVHISKIRDVDLEDLLQRDAVKLDLKKIAGYLHNQVVLVTGAGGSIGSELCRQICRLRPQRLILLEISENNLYEIDLELRENCPGIDLVPCLGDVKDAAKVNRIMEQHRPGVVFHAAAHKHVPMMERNPDEAVKNNIIGTAAVARAADKHGAETFILISTDKAVNPTSVMGATKRLVEMIMVNMNHKSRTKFAAVRFGNVLGSRGSVIPLFKKQIARGGPVTVTHPEMTRYFMTIPEAVQLVLQAGAIAGGGEIFVLDMGAPVKIVDLARDMIRLSGLEPDEDIEIEYTGVRPGEKMYEELLTAEENNTSTSHERIFIAQAGNGMDYDKIENILFNKLQRGIDLSKGDIIAMLEEMLPEFKQEGKTEVG